MKDKLTDYKTDDLSNLINDPIQSTSAIYQKINIYNNIDIPLQKIWLKTPKLKLFRSIKSPNGKFNRSIPLQIMLDEKNKDSRKLRIFMRKLEIKINKLVRELTDNNKIKSKTSMKKIIGFPQIMSVNMPFTKVNDCYEFNFHIYNNTNKRINIDYLESGTDLALILELSEVWISATSFGYNWTVKQLKVYPKLDFSKCLFIEDDDIDAEPVIQEECYHCMYCPNNHIRTHVCGNIPFVPTVPVAYMASPPPPPPYMPKISVKQSNNPIKITKNFAPTVADLMKIKLRPISVDTTNSSSDDLDVSKKKYDYMSDTVKKLEGQLKARAKNRDIDDQYKKLMEEWKQIKGTK